MLNTSQKSDSNSKVTPIEAARKTDAAKTESEKKWGATTMKRGFCMLPSLLFKGQRKLGLSVTQLAVVVHLADFWWHEGKMPWPKKATIAQRLSISEKTVQRTIRSLEQAGYVKRVPRKSAHGQTSNAYDLKGLVQKLHQIAPQFEEVAKAHHLVEKPGGLKVNKQPT